MCNILGQTSLDVDASVTIGDLVGKSVEIMVKNTKSNGKTYQNVTEVLTPENDGDVVEEIGEDAKIGKETKTVTKEKVSEPELDVTEEAPDSEEISEDDLPF